MVRIAFVGWLFIMAIACLITAAAEASLGWFVGGVVLFSVAIYASRQFKKEREVGRATASNKFIIFAFLAFFVGFAIIMFLSEA